jgi:hypothetical protein
VNVVSSVAISVPVIGVGFAVQSLGLYDAPLAFAIVIGALTLVTETVNLTDRADDSVRLPS